MNAVKTELTVSIPYEGCYVGVKVAIDWTMEDDEPCIHGALFVADLGIGSRELESIALEYLVKHLEEQGRQNEITEANTL